MAEIRSRRNGRPQGHDSLADAFGGSKGERLLFLCPHDDDAVIGAGLLLAVAAREGYDIHVGIVTDGRMGYCRLEDRHHITEIRRHETLTSYKLLGIPEKKIHFLGFGDGLLYQYVGRRPAAEGDPVVCGFTGLQNQLTHLIRHVRPKRVFTPAGTDLHPDHQAVYKELLISVFHASGDIWPELGLPCETPEVYGFPCYVEMAEPPDLMVRGDEALLQQKLDAIACFASQTQIESMVQSIREAGPVEFCRNIRFRLYHPSAYAPLFEETDP